MGYYIRVLTPSGAHVPLRQLRARLSTDCPGVGLSTDDNTQEWDALTLHHPDGETIAVVERNAVEPGSLAESELEEFADELVEARPASAARWLQGFLP